MRQLQITGIDLQEIVFNENKSRVIRGYLKANIKKKVLCVPFLTRGRASLSLFTLLPSLNVHPVFIRLVLKHFPAN